MNTLWGVPYFVWLIICLVIAFIYLIFFPKEAIRVSTSPAERVILRYAHALVWFLLAMACVFANYNHMAAVHFTAFSSLIVYLAFVTSLIRVKFKK